MDHRGHSVPKYLIFGSMKANILNILNHEYFDN